MLTRRPAAATLATLLARGAAGWATSSGASGDLDLEATAPLAADDECGASAGSPGRNCAVQALQLSLSTGTGLRRTSAEVEQQAESEAKVVAETGAVQASNASSRFQWGGAGSWYNPDGVNNPRTNCWGDCQGAGWCEWYCGAGGACCRWGYSGSDPPECTDATFPIYHLHTCVRSPMKISRLQTIYKDPLLLQPSGGKVFDFYMYRVQNDEDYNPENQNLGNLGGMLWYLHNEIVWHPELKRSGTYFSEAKTRIERFRVKVRATQPLLELGMNFGVLNPFDWARCTGPYGCKNFARFGFTVGCETWDQASGGDFPHTQWDKLNHYPGAVWYSLPGVCPSGALDSKNEECKKAEPGGACRGGGDPTGTGDCTYTYEKVGELSIDELEGLKDPEAFIADGGKEYDRDTDKGFLMSFWDDIANETTNQARIDHALALFRDRYPDHPDLEAPPCDFDKAVFFPGRFSGWTR